MVQSFQSRRYHFFWFCSSEDIGCFHSLQICRLGYDERLTFVCLHYCYGLLRLKFQKNERTNKWLMARLLLLLFLFFFNVLLLRSYVYIHKHSVQYFTAFCDWNVEWTKERTNELDSRMDILIYWLLALQSQVWSTITPDLQPNMYA